MNFINFQIIITYSTFRYLELIFFTIAIGVFGYSSRSRKDLRPYFRVFLVWYFSVLVDQIYREINASSLEGYNFLFSVSVLIALSAAILLFIAVLKDYRKVKKEKNQNRKFGKKKISSFTFILILLQMEFLDILHFGIFIVLYILIVLAIIMSIRVYLFNKLITYLFLIFTIISFLFPLNTQILIVFGVIGAEYLLMFGDMVYILMIFTTGFISLYEKTLIDFDKAEFYKDLLAHDMNNILQTINTSVQLMERWNNIPDKSNKKEEMTELIKQQLQRGKSLISNVRKFSKIEEKGLTQKPVSIKNILKTAIVNIRNKFPENQLEINEDVPIESFKVQGGNFLLDAFENILLNGIIHNRSEKKKLWIKLTKIQQKGNTFIKLEIKDNGIGIKPERKKTVFERCTQKDKSLGGLGIGLSLVKKIIEGYGGKIWTENRIKDDYTKGSNFVVILPKANC